MCNEGKLFVNFITTLRKVLYVIFNLVSSEHTTFPTSQIEHTAQRLIKGPSLDSSTASPEPRRWIPIPNAATNCSDKPAESRHTLSFVQLVTKVRWEGRELSVTVLISVPVFVFYFVEYPVSELVVCCVIYCVMCILVSPYSNSLYLLEKFDKLPCSTNIHICAKEDTSVGNWI